MAIRPPKLLPRPHILLWITAFAVLLPAPRAEVTGKEFFRNEVPLRDASRLTVPLYPIRHSSFRLTPGTLIRQEQLTPRFSRGPTVSSNEVAMVDGYATETVYFVFVTEVNKTIADYAFAMQSTNQRVCTREDFKVEQTQSIPGGYNVTATIEFDKWVGTTDLTFTATETTSRNVTVSTSQTCTVLGISCYKTELNGTLTLVSGPNYPLNLTTAEIRNNSKVDLGCLLQYGDGTDSSESLSAKYPLSGITITPSGVEKQVTHNSATCSDTGNLYNGSTVVLGAGCAYGMSGNSVNETYVGPKFGLNLNRNRNGTFDLRYEWSSVLQGSTLESVGYEMVLTVNIDGECYPIVTEIVPTGPFGSLGTDIANLSVDNLPTNFTVATSWQYDLAIRFADGTNRSATLVPDGVQTHANESATLTFLLPRGTGVNLPWDLNCTKPTEGVLPADDQTQPPYLFNLENLVRLANITPSSGSERGGINITLNGEFPLYDPANSGVYFDGTIIPSISVIGYDERQINFTLPQKVAENFIVSVSVQVDGRSSNALPFEYIPSTKLISMSPDYGPTSGGTEVTLAGQFIGYASNNSAVFFGGSQLNASQVISANDTTIVFTTPPKIALGDDDVYAYNVTVQVKDEMSDPLLFRYQAPVSITGISPSFGPEEGGTQVTLTGVFSSFTPESGAVYFGGQRLNSSTFVSSTPTEIVFRTPPRSDIGAAFTHEVWVVALEVESNRVKFTYGSASAGLQIIANGGNYETDSGKYALGACGNADFQAYLSSGARTQNPLFLWTLVDAATNENILNGTDVVTDGELLLLPYDIYPSKNTDYLLTLTISTDFIRSEVKTLTIVQRDIQSIGVRIIDPRPRSISNPNVTLTIPSVISLPGCTNTDLKIDNTSMTYVWEFQSNTYLFSYLNDTSPEGVVGPTLLGREFQVPQTAMSYGQFIVRLTAYFTEYSIIRGSDLSTLVIRPAPLLAQINSGEDTQYISELQDFPMSAARSRDPDVLTGDDGAGLTFEWACMHSTDPTFATNTTCSDALLPSISSLSFSISRDGLSSIRSSTEPTYIQYSLIVKKFSLDQLGNILTRVSRRVTSVLIISQASAKRYEALVDIIIRNNQTSEVDRKNVKYFEDVIITPVSKTTDTIWEFQLVEPLSQASLLSNPNNLIPFTGYYSFGLRAGRYSLGVLANKLTPNTVYTFRIFSYRTGYERNEQTVSFRTVEKPVVTIGKLPRSNGTTNSTFYVTASTNYDSDFKYYIIVSDQYGFDYCVDGCQGVSIARFRLASPGSYALRCEVFDSLGFTLLASALSSTNITVVAPIEPYALLELAGQSELAFESGDHALYQQLANDMVKTILESTNRTADPVLDSEIVTNITYKIAHITANSVPNTVQSSNFVRTAASIARLSPTMGITLNISTIYQLINITELAVDRTPDTAALQQLEDVLEFYNLVPILILQTFTANTSNSGVGYSSGTMRVIFADCYEQMKKQVAVISMKNALCGARLAIESGTMSKSGKALALRHESTRPEERAPEVFSFQEQKNVSINPMQGLIQSSSFRVAKLCNPEQGLELFINEDTDREIRFKACSGIFKESFRDLLFAVSKTPDYIWLSGVNRMETRVEGLVSVSVSEVGAGNVLLADQYSSPNCFEVEMPLYQVGNLSHLVSKENALVPAVRFAPPRHFGAPMENLGDYYRASTKGLSAKITRKKLADGSMSTIRGLIVTANTGVYAVRAIDLGSLFSLRGIRWTVFIVLGVLFITILLIGLIAVGVWRYTAVAAAAAPIEGVPVDTDFTYVERDIYGRGTAVDMLDPQDDALSPLATATGAAAAGAGENVEPVAEELELAENEDGVEEENQVTAER